MDNEIAGVGNVVTYEYRVEDSRLGRFLSIDPLSPKYPFYSPYAFSGNRVIDMVELEGLEPADTDAEEGWTHPAPANESITDLWGETYVAQGTTINWTATNGNFDPSLGSIDETVITAEKPLPLESARAKQNSGTAPLNMEEKIALEHYTNGTGLNGTPEVAITLTFGGNFCPSIGAGKSLTIVTK